MIDTTVFQDKKAAYYTLGCKLNFSETSTIGKMLKEKCDFLISIPMYGKVNSLNVSTAASVILCEVARQNRS